MSTVVDVSSKLGEYMLKGWVLTDRICSKCAKVPLLRSPNDRTVLFCANCDGSPTSLSSAPSAPRGSSSQTQTQSEASSIASLELTSYVSGPSTPPTEMSSVLSSPTFTAPTDTAETLRRRQQSDVASAEIGRRLLKGWAMLADECPNLQCYGIPLVRPPKSGAGKVPRKECVVCHTVYVDQADSSGIQRLVPLTSSSQLSSSETSSNDTAHLLSSQQLIRNEQLQELNVSKTLANLPISVEPVHEKPATTSPVRDLDAAAAALEQSMRSLTQRLTLFSSGNNVDPSMIGQTADAVSKVSQALMHVKQLRWSERQALGS